MMSEAQELVEQWQFRPAQVADLPRIEDLLSKSGLPDTGITDRISDGFVVAVNKNEIVAAAGVEKYGNNGFLRSVVVEDAYRGTGLGKAIVMNRIEWSANHGIETNYLLTMTAEIAAFFERAGFAQIPIDLIPEPVHASAEFKLDVCRGAIAMERANIEIRTHTEIVKEKYGQLADQVASGKSASCCSGSCNPITSDLYNSSETGEVPIRAAAGSLGCGNPTALINLEEGQTVLDLGSGGGIDVLLSARRVGPTGHVYGLDMTDEMLKLANQNLLESGLKNVEFIKGEIEDIPLPDNSVDVVISNCVINLSSDKSRVLREAHRVLRDGGRFAVSDIVARTEVPDEIKQDAALVLGCIGGSLVDSDYRERLQDSGFVDIDFEPTREYTAEDLGALGANNADSMDKLFYSAFVRATKKGSVK